MSRFLCVLAMVVVLIMGAGAAGACGGSGIPDDVEWTVVGGWVGGMEPDGPGGGNYRVRLNKPAPEEVLRAIGKDVKRRHINVCRDINRPQCERWYPELSTVGVWFYLPGMDIEVDMAWGRAFFLPDKEEIEIIGLTAEEENQLLAEPIPEGRQVIGRWISQGDADLSAITSVYTQSGKTFVERKFVDGSTMTSETVESTSSTGRRFTIVDDSFFSVPGRLLRSPI